MKDQDAKGSQGANLDHGWQQNPDDGRLDTPTFHRNHAGIVKVISDHLAPEATGHALEIGSGSGQHVIRFAKTFPLITWIPSDPEVRHRTSIAAWSTSSGQTNVLAPEDIDVSALTWAALSDTPLCAMVCINVLHIAPWSVTLGLLSGAERHLSENGRLFIYGPFREDGVHTSDSNASFDQTLRSRNPEWGVRDLSTIEAEAGACGLVLVEKASMPANNLTLVLRRGA